jgi:hypothetical protein
VRLGALVPAPVEERPGGAHQRLRLRRRAVASACCASTASAYQGSSERAARIPSTSARVPPCSRSLGVASTSAPTRAGCADAQAWATRQPAECPSTSTADRPRCSRSASTSSAMRSKRSDEGSAGTSLWPVARRSRRTRVRVADSPPRSSR